MGLSIKALFRIECRHFSQARIVVNADMCVGGDFPLFIFFKLVGQAQKVGVRVAFKYVHPEQGRSGHARLERVVIGDLIRY